MPNMAEISRRGTVARMSSTVPDVSSVAWTTFMTGVNPGRHGIFGFVDLKPGTYTSYFPNATHVRSPTLWRLLGKEGRRSVIINMPSTYPAQELDGVLIAGFVAIDLDRATYPKRLVPWLQEIGYMLDVDTSRAGEASDRLIKDLHTSLEKSELVVRRLMKEEPWDFFAAIVTGTDRLHHFMWADYETADSPHHSSFLDYYRAVDGVVGRLYNDLNGEVHFLALSDHGFGRLSRDVYINRWLEDEGYLRFADPKRESVADIDPARTRAFCLDPGRIYINLKRRFPQGSVDLGKPYESLLKELIEKFSNWYFSDDGGEQAKVIHRIFRKEDLYHGPFLHTSPDLVLLATRGNNLRGATGRETVFGLESTFTGMHTQDDAFFLADRPFEAPQDLHILDASKTVLTLLEASSVDRIEGRPLLSPDDL
jgi:predicted AlkP superfamily phosphohydrolase/phosphomutase